MSLLSLIIAIAAIGVVMWLLNTYVPMAPPIKTILNVVVIIILLFWILSALGLLGALNRPIR